jgi:predicted dehydrogenase
MVRDALLAGKHVFCEKSLVFKPEEVRALRTLTAEHPALVVQVGLQRRCSRLYQAAHQMVSRGLLGTVTHIRAQWHRNGSWRRPLKDSALERQVNWRLYREYSGGLAAELGSHQFDVANWIFGACPERITGVGGLDYWKDGRDIYDNIQLIFEYPNGGKLQYSAISTNARLDFSETILGTQGSLDITLGWGMWFREASVPKVGLAGAAKENWIAGATIGRPGVPQGVPLFLPEQAPPALRDQVQSARRWFASQGVELPEEEPDPVAAELEEFLACARDGRRPKADVEIGLADSTAVILTNVAMERRQTLAYREIDAFAASSSERAATR